MSIIVGADLATYWTVIQRCFEEMLRIGLPLIGPHTATFYGRPLGRTPAGATLRLDCVFVSRLIADRLTVRALNDPDDR